MSIANCAACPVRPVPSLPPQAQLMASDEEYGELRARERQLAAQLAASQERIRELEAGGGPVGGWAVGC